MDCRVRPLIVVFSGLDFTIARARASWACEGGEKLSLSNQDVIFFLSRRPHSGDMSPREHGKIYKRIQGGSIKHRQDQARGVSSACLGTSTIYHLRIIDSNSCQHKWHRPAENVLLLVYLTKLEKKKFFRSENRTWERWLGSKKTMTLWSAAAKTTWKIGKVM